MSAFERIIQFDFWLFSKVNGTWTNNFFDALFPLLRESVIWIPLYMFLFIFAWLNFGVKGLYWAIGLICAASLCDIVSSHLIKESILRLRPCRNPLLSNRVRFLVIYCPMSSSFISSHATTHFGVATFVYSTLRKYTTAWVSMFFVWAAVICYAQVYVGVHFPLDVFCGSLVGCLLGSIISKIFNSYVTLIINPIKNL